MPASTSGRSRSSTLRRNAGVSAAPSTMRSRACWRIASSSRDRKCARSKPSWRRSAARAVRSPVRAAPMRFACADGVGDRPGRCGDLSRFTFCATAEVVALCGATPVMADVDAETFNLDPASLERAVATAKKLGLKPWPSYRSTCSGCRPITTASQPSRPRTHLLVLDDAAQSFGATYRGRKLGALAPATATSFFPAKPLGCYGDGGAIMTDDDDLAVRLKSLARCTARGPTNTTLHASASLVVSIPSRRRCCWRSSRFPRRDRCAQCSGATLHVRGLRASRRCPASAMNRHRSGRNTPSGSRRGGGMCLRARL